MRRWIDGSIVVRGQWRPPGRPEPIRANPPNPQHKTQGNGWIWMDLEGFGRPLRMIPFSSSQQTIELKAVVNIQYWSVVLVVEGRGGGGCWSSSSSCVAIGALSGIYCRGISEGKVNTWLLCAHRGRRKP